MDAFLLAAGIVQVLEDALHPDPLALSRVAGRLAGWPGGMRRAGAASKPDGPGVSSSCFRKPRVEAVIGDSGSRER